MLLLYIVLRTRYDMHSTTDILPRRLTKILEDDYRKMRGLIRYIVGIIDKVCYLEKIA